MSVSALEVRPTASNALKTAALRLASEFGLSDSIEERNAARLRNAGQKCGSCRVWKPVTAFHADSARMGLALHNWCKECRK